MTASVRRAAIVHGPGIVANTTTVGTAGAPAVLLAASAAAAETADATAAEVETLVVVVAGAAAAVAAGRHLVAATIVGEVAVPTANNNRRISQSPLKSQQWPLPPCKPPLLLQPLRHLRHCRM